MAWDLCLQLDSARIHLPYIAIMSSTVLFVSTHTSLSCQLQDNLILYYASYTYFLLLLRSDRLFCDSRNTKSLLHQPPDAVRILKEKRKLGNGSWLSPLKKKREITFSLVRKTLQQLAEYFCDFKKEVPFVLLERCTQRHGVCHHYLYVTLGACFGSTYAIYDLEPQGVCAAV